MPIKLDQLQKSAPVIDYKPTFFHRELTGQNKLQGVLHQHANPNDFSKVSYTPAHMRRSECKHEVQNGVSTYVWPVYVLAPIHWQRIARTTFPDPTDVFCCTAGKMLSNGEDIYLTLMPHVVSVSKPENGKAADRRVSISYDIRLYCKRDKLDQKARLVEMSNATSRQPEFFDASHLKFTHDSLCYYGFTCNPVHIVEQMLVDFAGLIDFDTIAIDEFFNGYDTSLGVRRRSEIWQTTIDAEIKLYLDAIAPHVTNGLNRHSHIMQELIELSRTLEYYNVSLQSYRNIYAHLRATLDNAALNTVCKTNLNLLLSDLMTAAEQAKPTLNRVKPPAGQKIPADPFFSPEQSDAITTEEPLVLAQAGAGTGKALPLDEPVLTPSGWRAIGLLKLDDEVIGADGKPHKVTAIHTQGVKEGVRITLTDGSSVRCCTEHLWTLTDANGDEHVMTTAEWLRHPERETLRVQRGVAADLEANELGIPPYLLGALLMGLDASDTFNVFTYHAPDVDAETILHVAFDARMTGHRLEEEVSRYWTLVPDEALANNDFAKRYGSMSFTEVFTATTHDATCIPQHYLLSSLEDRVLLASAIADHSAKTSADTRIARVNHESLADDIVQLFWSLGVVASKHKAPDAQGFAVRIIGFDDEESLAKTAFYDESYPRTLARVDGITPCEMRCIEVDADDHLYITRDFIVTHNSTTINGRLKYMEQCGIDPSDIMVLSFTNAAADHILDIAPRVHSMTIANMVHTIYMENFPGQQLSSESTLANTLHIYYPNDDFARRFANVVMQTATKGSTSQSYTNLNSFVEENFDQVMQVLNTIGQVTINLEIIICYQQIDNLTEPDKVKSKHLIIDEVQDNSIFEFVYALKYIVKNKESLFIVGERHRSR